MKFSNIIKVNGLSFCKIMNQFLHMRRNFFRVDSLNLAYFVWIFLIITDYNIIFLIIDRKSVFQELMQMLDVFFSDLLMN